MSGLIRHHERYSPTPFYLNKDESNSMDHESIVPVAIDVVRLSVGH